MEEKIKREEGSDEGSSSDETEDDDGFLATEDLDAQISATLQALKSKDPRVYNKDTKFYDEENDEVQDDGAKNEKKEKPVFLKDYHREKFMRGDVGASDDEEEAPQTYAQEQDSLKKSIIKEINDAEDEDESEADDDTFMKKKAKKAEKLDANGVHPSRVRATKITDRDVETAERDPENFLSNFLSSRAWVPEDGPKWQAFESDDESDGGKADEFEEAYNMRFENPDKSNEVLRSYARDITNARSVRRDEKTGRQRQRELEKERKEEEKAARREDKARLRRLKLDETEGKLKKIRQAAGALGNELTDEDLMKFLDDEWENDAWEGEMQKRFGDGYYAMQDADFKAEEEEDDEDAADDKKKHAKKPKWDDDIDIKDIVPDFEEEEEAAPAITLSDEEAGEPAEEEAEEEDEDEDEDENAASKKRKTKDLKRERLAKQKQARQERAKLEALVDSKLQLTNHDLLSKASASSSSLAADGLAPFRYRETSPQTFGMTARDILLAPSDQALNEFAGLKKLATFRDEEKKRKDKKKFGKKARLRQWRRDNFGSEFERTGPTYGFERVIREEDVVAEESRNGGASKRRLMEEKEDGNVIGDVGEKGKKKRKRSKGKKAAVDEE